MQPKGRCQYILDANGAWIPWEGTASGSGEVTLFSPSGTAIDTPAGTADNITTVETLATAAFTYGFDGTNWDRFRSGDNNTDNVAPLTIGVQAVSAYSMMFDGSNWDRMRTGNTVSDGVAGVAALSVMGQNYIFGGTNYDRQRSISAANVALAAQIGVTAVGMCGNWSINHTPAANTQATITRAAVASQRHVCTSITASLIGLAASAEATVLINLRDGATGTGTILWSTRLLVAGTTGTETGISLSNLSIFGTANTAMTLEFETAGGASTFESVALTGYTVA